MRNLIALSLWIAVSAAPTGAADFELRPHDPSVVDRPARTDGAVLTQKVDAPADVFLVPFYLVDTTDPFGTTTLFAVRNRSASNLDLSVQYVSPALDVMRQDNLTLGPRETLTRNVRDVAGLPADPDGFRRGFVRTTVTGSPPGVDNLTGDFLQVDVAGNFATGDRLFTAADLCDEQEIRFLDFGDGTLLRILINSPQGGDELGDPPSVTVGVLGEDGAVFPATDIFTGLFMIELTAADFTTLDFGTLLFDFSNSSGGFVFAEYSAGGRFSVGMNGACTAP